MSQSQVQQLISKKKRLYQKQNPLRGQTTHVFSWKQSDQWLICPSQTGRRQLQKTKKKRVMTQNLPKGNRVIEASFFQRTWNKCTATWAIPEMGVLPKEQIRCISVYLSQRLHYSFNLETFFFLLTCKVFSTLVLFFQFAHGVLLQWHGNPRNLR